MVVRELTDGQELDLVLLVRELRGGKQLRLVLGDRSGTVTAAVPDGDGVAFEHGAAVRVQGRYTVHPDHGPEIALEAVRAARADEIDYDALLDGPPRDAAQMEADLRDLIATIQNPHLRDLLEALLGPESETWPRFRDAPAAKRYHQAYRHGLLEHSLTVAQSVSSISATFPGIDRDVAITGALLHDVGKLDAYTTDPLAIDMTDAGKLQGEIPLGYYRVRRLTDELPGFPADLAAAVLHIILSHHGALEHGSPVVPCTREATLVHMIDNLGGRLGSFDRLEKQLPDGSRWSRYDRALGGGAFFADREAA
jgi:3'-5' exoribonuclease